MTGTGGGSTGPTTLIFSANDGTNGVEPWVSDGTVIGTQMLEDINGSGGDSNPEGFTRVGDRIIFTAIGPDGRELWAVESDLGGAQQIRDINPSGDGVDAGQSFPVLDGHAYFRGNDPSNGGQELWRTDGNQAERIANIRSPGDSTPHNFAVFNGHVFFAADDGTNGIQLWKTDGTNTQMVGPFSRF